MKRLSRRIAKVDVGRCAYEKCITLPDITVRCVYLYSSALIVTARNMTLLITLRDKVNTSCIADPPGS